MIAKLAMTQKHRTPTNNVRYIKQCINNNITTALEPTAAYATGGLNAFTGVKSSP